MRIALDVSPLDRPHATGVEKALLQLLAGLKALPDQNEYFLVAPKRPWLLPELADPRFRPVSLVGGGRRLLWRERLVPAFAHRVRVDLWHSPVQAIPLLLDRPKVATLHELSWMETEEVDDEGSLARRRGVAYIVSRSADRIVCVSECTRRDFLTLHPSAEPKTVVIHHGVDPVYAQAKPDPMRLSEAYDVPADVPWFLTLGRALKRKGLPHAVRALRVLLDRTGGPYHLVMAGEENATLRAARDLAVRLGLAQRVHITGYVNEPDLPALYAGAAALLVPSESEGFGMPLLEAMAAGTPVVANRRAALPEVAGGAAILVDFQKPLEAAEGLLRALGNEREDWIERGRARAAQFPVEAPARKLLALWRELAG
ncbi:MAG: glycosyltransferase family 1 protein [Planctomycetota bacterium]|nr:MAG: glycosyltransferase family 1 protein [Planctomycetota bacterium]